MLYESSSGHHTLPELSSPSLHVVPFHGILREDSFMNYQNITANLQLLALPDFLFIGGEAQVLFQLSILL